MEWDDPGCGDKQNRVSPWDIETPESLFVLPALTSTLKRPFGSSFVGEQTEWGNMVTRPFANFSIPSVSNQWSEQLVSMLTKPQTVNNTVPISPIIKNTFATSEMVKSVPPPFDPTVNPQNLVNEVPTLNQLSPIEQLDPSLCGFFPLPGQETWDSHEDVYNCMNFEVGYGGGSVFNPSVSSAMLDEFKDSNLRNPSDYLVNNNYSSSQDVHSQLTSSSTEEFTDTGLMQNGMWQQVAPPPRVRTYTKVRNFPSNFSKPLKSVSLILSPSKILLN